MIDLFINESDTETSQTSKRIKLNASGTKFEITAKRFSTFPEVTRLGKLSKYENMSKLEIELLCDEFDSDSTEFFFDRDPIILQMVLNYLINGELHINTNACEIFIDKELKYWMIDSMQLNYCCKADFEDKHKNKSDFIEISKQIDCYIHDREKKKTFREALWHMTEHPWSSKGAAVYFLITNFFLVSWLVYFIWQSDPSVVQARNDNIKSINNSNTVKTYGSLTVKQLNDLIIGIDLSIFSYFALDLIFRFILSPSKIKFVKNLINIIDFLSIIIFFILEFIRLSLDYEPDQLFYARRIVESFRVLMFIKLAKISWRFNSVVTAIIESYRELFMAFFCILISVLILSTFMFYFETVDNFNMFYSIPATFWWTIVTMTTVGYGDIVPITVQGKLLASFTCVWGIVLVALPIAIIGGNFAEVYTKEILRNKWKGRRIKMKNKEECKNTTKF